MGEELKDIITEENIKIADAETVESEVLVEDMEQSFSIEETVETAAIELVEEIEVDISESVGWVGGDNTRHYSLYGREESDQHPITAITNLREELDTIEALQPIYSNEFGHANYYAWKGEARDEVGYFVSLIPGSSMIKICEGDDIFGVTVSTAGFIGGQDGETLDHVNGITTIPGIERDNSYGLVATSGLVKVICETDVSEGDYVVSNGYGWAQKTDSKCGYKVISIDDKDKGGARYASIVLGIQACTTDNLGKNLQYLGERMEAAESNIISAVNVANQAYNKSQESAVVSEEAIRNALESMQKVDEVIEVSNVTTEIASSASQVAAQAKAISESAVVHAETLSTTAINRANDAWAKADDVVTEVYSLTAKIDQYSVGEYSQAYGLTLEQAQGILEPGMIYAPTKHIDKEIHTEIYAYTNDAEEPKYTRTFTPGFLYQWSYLPTLQKYGWSTIDKDYQPTDEINISSKAVYLSFKEPSIHEGSNFGYWYTDGEEIEDKNGDLGTYEPYTLYKWERDHWLAVATLKGSVSNRAVSEIYQTTNEITMGVSNTRGCISAISSRLSETEALVTSTAKWTKGSDESGNILSYNLAAIDQSANEDGSSISLAVADMEGNKVLNGAHIVLGQESEESYIGMDADRINLDTKAFTVRDENGQALLSAGNNTVEMAGWTVKPTSLVSDGNIGENDFIGLYTSDSGDNAAIAGVPRNDWRLAIGSNFGVDKNGGIYATKGEFTGKVTATSGQIGDAIIEDGKLWLSSETRNLVLDGQRGFSLDESYRTTDENGNEKLTNPCFTRYNVASINNLAPGTYTLTVNGGLSENAVNTNRNYSMSAFVWFDGKDGTWKNSKATHIYNVGDTASVSFTLTADQTSSYTSVSVGCFFCERNGDGNQTSSYNIIGIGSYVNWISLTRGSNKANGCIPSIRYDTSINKNLLENTEAPTTSNPDEITAYNLNTDGLALEDGDICTLQLKGILGSDKTHFGILDVTTNKTIVNLYRSHKFVNKEDVFVRTFTWKYSSGSMPTLRVYAYPLTGQKDVNTTVEWVKLEKGAIATAYSETQNVVDNWAYTGNNTTTISGGKVDTGSVNAGLINAEKLKVDYIKSSNCANVTAEGYTDAGTYIDLSNGGIHAKNFYINSNGSAYFKGVITATGGSIANWTLDDNVRMLFQATTGLSAHTSTNDIYASTSLVSSGSSPVRFFSGATELMSVFTNNPPKPSSARFRVLEDGSLYATAASIMGDIYATGTLKTEDITCKGEVIASTFVGNYISVSTLILEGGANTIKSSNANGSYIAMDVNEGISRTCTVELTEVEGSGEAVITLTSGTLLYPQNFQIRYNVAFSGKYSYTTMRLNPGESSVRKKLTNDWLADPTVFADTKTTTYTFTQSASVSGIKIKGDVFPESDNAYDLGGLSNSWANIYAETAYYMGSTAVHTSDANKKNTINLIDEKYSALFDSLKPVTFKFNDGTSGRTHIGLIAQELKASMDACGIDSQDCAAYCSWDDENGNETCGIRYGEFIPLNIYEIQKLKARVAELENQIALLKEQ